MIGTHTGVRSTRWRWIAAIWFAGGLFDASQTVLIMHAEGRHHAWLPLSRNRTGVGIGNLRTRLQILHGNESELQLRCADPGGVEVVVRLPFREA
jgi:LytS/YehU family sensor histidine kinase